MSDAHSDPPLNCPDEAGDVWAAAQQDAVRPGLTIFGGTTPIKGNS